MRQRWLGLVLLLAACEDGAELNGDLFPSYPLPGTVDSGLTPLPGTPGGGTAWPEAGTSWDGGSLGGGTGGPGGGDGGAGGTSSGVPCAVQAILRDKCQTCHSDPPVGAPFPLVTREHLAGTTGASPIASRIKARINDASNPMPPAARPQLSGAEKQVLNAYLDSNLPASNESCDTPDGGTPDGDEEEDYLPPDSECEVIMEMRAHGGQTVNDTTPFVAPAGGNHYEMFYFKPTWTKKMQVIRVDPIIDNGAVLHHWLLYMEEGKSDGEGTHEKVNGLHPGAQLLSGWAPGNKSVPLGRDVGMQVISGPNARFGIEIHYNTSSAPASRADRSGVRLCLTSKLRPKEAGTHWLGTQFIAYTPPLVLLGKDVGNAYEASGRCTVPKEAHIIAYSPHMHTRGRYAKSIITRKNGEKITLNDGPFDFEDQQIFPVKTASGAREIVVQPGDVINTTCGYAKEGTFLFGPGTEEEMCYNFVVAWPVGSLAGSEGAVGGKNTCIDPGT